MDTPETPLKYGALAPAFRLTTPDGTVFTREQFRGRSGLVLIFFATPTPEIVGLLDAISRDEAEYRELNVRVLAISGAPANTVAPAWDFIPRLSDADGEAWRTYAQTDPYGYAVFVLDTYGGVEAQKVSPTPDGLPEAALILRWTRGAQYKCSV